MTRPLRRFKQPNGDNSRLMTIHALTDQPSAAPSPCNWHADYEGAWESDCGLVWCLEEDVPSKNEMAFCPKCGKPMVEHPYVDPPTCDECGEELQDGKCPDGCTPDKGKEVLDIPRFLRKNDD